LLNPATKISAQYEAGAMKSGLGFGKWFRDQTVIVHTSGTYDNAAKSTVNGAGQTGTAITVSALGGTLVAGDFVTFDGVFAVNRVTKATQAKLRQFVVLADAAVGAVSVSIYPALTPAVGGSTVQYQTVTASPANGANMTSATKSGEIYYKNLVETKKSWKNLLRIINLKQWKNWPKNN
jgi:hypothetical protein